MLMSRNIIAICYAFLVLSEAVAQTTLPSIVKQYNQKQLKTPLARVEVMTSNAGNAVSATDVTFTLTFRTLRPVISHSKHKL